MVYETRAERRYALARTVEMFGHLKGIALLVPGFADDLADVLPELLVRVEELREVVERIREVPTANQSRGTHHLRDEFNMNLPGGRYPVTVDHRRSPSPPPYASVAPTVRAYSPEPPRDYARRALPTPPPAPRSPPAESSRQYTNHAAIRRPTGPAVSTVGMSESNVPTMNTAGQGPALSRNQQPTNEVPPASYRLRVPREYRGLTGAFGPEAQTNFEVLHQAPSNTPKASGQASASTSRATGKGKGRAHSGGEDHRNARSDVARNRLRTLDDFARWADRVEAEGDDDAPLPAFLHPWASVYHVGDDVGKRDARRRSPVSRYRRPAPRQNAVAGPSTAARPNTTTTAAVTVGIVHLPPPPPPALPVQGLKMRLEYILN